MMVCSEEHRGSGLSRPVMQNVRTVTPGDAQRTLVERVCEFLEHYAKNDLAASYPIRAAGSPSS